MSNDGFLSRASGFISQFVVPFSELRGPLVASVIAFIGLSFPAQTIEIYRALALDRQVFLPQISLAISSLLLSSIVIWYIARNFTLRWQAREMQSHTIAGLLLRWLPRILGALPLLGAGIGVLMAAKRIDTITIAPWFNAQMKDVYPHLDEASRTFSGAQVFLTTAGYSLCALAVLFVVLTYLRSRNKFNKYDNPNRFLFGRALPLTTLFLVVCAVIAFCIYYALEPNAASELAIQIGSLAIFNIFIVCLAFTLGYFTLIHHQTKFPVITVLVIVAFISTAFDLNDNHQIRLLKPNTEQQDNLSLALTRWLKSRPDLAYYQTAEFPYLDKLGLSEAQKKTQIEERRQYPIYVIAAQGGGLYAAHQTALTLARIQDRCPAFAQHVFAISGVSGGSLGAALFAALVKFRTQGKPPISDPTCLETPVRLDKPGWYEERVNIFMSSDFLSPLVAAGLFPDFIQRFLPYPIPQLDRARAFEVSLERAWKKAVPEDKKNMFARNFYRLWKQQGIVPALVLNTVEVQSGSRRLVSPFVFKGKTLNSLETMRPITKHNIRTSTAVALSARFPWLLPAATVTDDSNRQFRFVDGGIYEYSGAATALEIAEYMKGHLKYVYNVYKKTGKLWNANARVQMLVISDDEILEDASEPREIQARSLAKEEGHSQRTVRKEGGLRVRDDQGKNIRQGFGELLSPVRSLLNSRTERAIVWVTRAFDKFCPHCYKTREYNWARMPFPGFHGAVGLNRLNHTDYQFTLGWQLSHATRQVISAHSGFAHHCKAAISEIYNGWPWAGLVFNQNNCSACRIEHDLETSWYTLVARLRRNIKFGGSRSIITLCRGDDLAHPHLSPPPPVSQPDPAP